jgi:chromate reductase, NAD(P)H dehydrogenase (quinone)
MSTPDQLKVLAICGSLRTGSFNAGLVQEIVDDAPPSIRVDVLEGLDRLPLINNDLVVDNVPPAAVTEIGGRIRAADALIIACPEYCYGIPAPLKNLLDWMSFPPPVNPLRFNPVGILGASIGAHGTLRAQHSLRQCLLFHDAMVMSKPEVYVTDAAKKFADGRLTDENTKKLIPLFLENFEEFTRATLARQLDPATREFQFT